MGKVLEILYATEVSRFGLSPIAVILTKAFFQEGFAPPDENEVENGDEEY